MSHRVVIEPLTATRFALFGEVIAHSGTERRRYLSTPLEARVAASRPCFWVSRLETQASLPFRLDKLECHPNSAQTFIPLTQTRQLIVVAPTASDGSPALSELRAFVTAGGQGISYRPGVWHQGLSVLDAPAEFVVFMWLANTNDDVFWDVPAEIVVTAGEHATVP
jgi:ureidoglycolate lyase